MPVSRDKLSPCFDRNKDWLSQPSCPHTTCSSFVPQPSSQSPICPGAAPQSPRAAGVSIYQPLFKGSAESGHGVGHGKKKKNRLQFSSVQFSRSVVSDSFRPHELQHARPPCPSPAPGIHQNSCPSSRWCHPAISSSAVPFSSCPQSLSALGSFPISQLFTWGGQSIGGSASASVLPMNTQDWSPSGWSGWISMQSKGLSRVFSKTRVQKHQFFGAQPSSQFNSHMHTWPLEKP